MAKRIAVLGPEPVEPDDGAELVCSTRLDVHGALPGVLEIKCYYLYCCKNKTTKQLFDCLSRQA